MLSHQCHGLDAYDYHNHQGLLDNHMNNNRFKSVWWGAGGWGGGASVWIWITHCHGVNAEGAAEDGAGDSQGHGLYTQLWHHSWGPQVGQCTSEDPQG